MGGKDLYLTTHSKVRFNERSDYDYNQQISHATKAFKEGLEFSRFKEPFNSYLKELGYESNGRYVPKVYHQYVYIFENRCGHRLITLYPVPEEYQPCEQYQISKEDHRLTYIVLTNKDNGKIYYWSDCGIVDNIQEAIEFNNQVKASNYLNNNGQLNDLSYDYDIELYISDYKGE